MRFGGTLLASPASLPGGDAFLLVSSTGIGSTAPLATYQAAAAKGQADGYASLDSGGKLPAAQLPAIAITEYLGEAADQAAMLLLDGQQGDWTVRTDTGTVWIITGDDPSDVGDWTELSYPTAPVQSVAGKTGVVTLAAGDIASGTFADARISESSVTQHEAALAITTAQITGLDSYLLATDIATGTITPVAGDLTFTGGSEGDVLTQQSDGSFAPETPAGGASSPLTLTSGEAAEIPLTIEAHASQSGNLTQWENAAGAVRARVTASGLFSNSGGESNAEQFGNSITNPNASGVLIGAGVNGWGSSTGFGAVAVGTGAEGRGQYSVNIGFQANAFSNNYSVNVGYQARGAFGVGYGISLGAQSAHQAANQFVCGASSFPINTIYFGKGYSNATPTAYLIGGTNGSGTNIAGADLILAGGQGTGSGNGGDFKVQVALPGSSGSSLNSLADKFTVRGSDGLIVLDVPTSDPAVAGALWCDTSADRVLKVSAG